MYNIIFIKIMEDNNYFMSPSQTVGGASVLVVSAW